MFVISARNVNDAYPKGLRLLLSDAVLEPSRAGDVWVCPRPVTTVYTHPRERVLFDEKRDANPFFHLFEALWMLGGRQDAIWLDRFVSDFSKRFAEGDGTQHGAYGHRWRYHFDLEGGGHPALPDQIELVVGLLSNNPGDRRAVITMWDPVADLGANKKDVPCNLVITPRVRGEVLDITVFCRSNDAIWGVYGANAVHFSVLQEYLAARLGLSVGRYYQVSNNFHAYTTALERVGKPDPDDLSDPYTELVDYTSIVTEPLSFMGDLYCFLSDKKHYDYGNVFFPLVAEPLMQAAMVWRKDIDGALEIVSRMSPCDWSHAAYRWLARRKEKRNGG